MNSEKKFKKERKYTCFRWLICYFKFRSKDLVRRHSFFLTENKAIHLLIFLYICRLIMLFPPVGKGYSWLGISLERPWFGRGKFTLFGTNFTNHTRLTNLFCQSSFIHPFISEPLKRLCFYLSQYIFFHTATSAGFSNNNFFTKFPWGKYKS